MSTTDGYVAAVRSLIQHLPTIEREEILEDLTAQLNEEAAEPGIALEQRLGTPSAFAAEFVESLGEVARREMSAPVTAPPVGLRRWWSDVAPAWWMLRPFVIVGTIVLLVAHHRADKLTRVALLALGAAVAAAAVSWSRREGSAGGRWNLALSAVGVVSAVALGLALVSGSAARTMVVRPAPAAAIEMKCAMVAKERVMGPPDSPKFGSGKPFDAPDVPPICRRVLPLETTTTSTAPPPSTTSTTSAPPPTTTP